MKPREAALEIANHVRIKLGFEPVDHLYPGKKGLPNSCAITETIYDESEDLRRQYGVYTKFGSVRVINNDGKTVLSVPWRKFPGTTQFISRFDKGGYKDLQK